MCFGALYTHVRMSKHTQAHTEVDDVYGWDTRTHTHTQHVCVWWYTRYASFSVCMSDCRRLSLTLCLLEDNLWCLIF